MATVSSPTVWVVVIGALAGAILSYCLSFNHPPPGTYIAMLGVLALALSLRPERFGPIGTRERVVWIILAFALFTMELRVLYADQAERDANVAESRRLELDRFQQIMTRFDQQQHLPASTRAANERVARLPAGQATPDAKLKHDSTTLSQEILQFLTQRVAGEPPLRTGGAETWQQDTERYLNYSRETMSLYSQRFGARVIATRNALAARGLVDKELDSFYEYPTNPIGVRIVGERIGALAEQL